MTRTTASVCVSHPTWFFIVGLICLCGAHAWAGEADHSFRAKRCELVPLPGDQVAFLIDGVEITRWHFGSQYPRPFLFPFKGPAGVSLTRMGHPGAPNHDHHRSIWMAHASVNRHDFWSDNRGTQIRQQMWHAYRDGDDEAIMASAIGWYESSGMHVMQQELVIALRPLADGEHTVEIQLTVRPAMGLERVELGQTNFGFLAVRVAKSISAHFGGGRLTNSEGQKGEREVFGQRARWTDYSGPVVVGGKTDRKTLVEGITYFDHPENPRYPTYWHVRDDGWMSASFCMHEGFTVTGQEPLRLRYLLHAHAGEYDHHKAAAVREEFAERAGFSVLKATRKHRQFEVERKATAASND